MRQMTRLALAPLILVAGVTLGCGDGTDNTEVERSEAAVKGDQAVQDAMKAMMQSKKGAKKGAAKADEHKADAPKADEAPAE